VIEVEIEKEVYLPCFQHLLEENDIDIELLWGGRDSGKSKFVAQHLTEQCMHLDYFRCIMAREVFDTIKDANWQMIKDNAEDWKVDSLFTFRVSPLGIKCLNGNTFLARGMDKPGKIRSITNPSHVWIEEGNQLSEDAFITLLTSLRSDYGRVKVWITFNPEANCADFTEFWLYKMFFKGKLQQSFTDELLLETKVNGIKEIVRLRFRSTHVTYNDNPYVTPQRRAFHESLKETNLYWYNVFTLGQWGNEANDSPWAFAYQRSKHVSNGTIIAHPLLNRAQPLILSWDFNRNPICCSAIQDYDGHTRVLETIKMPKSGVDAVCTYIKTYYPGCLYIVTGDYSGNTETSLYQEQVTHYSMIKHHLSLSDGQIKIQPNPRLQKNQVHVNTILAYYKVTFHGEKAKALIFDCENVKKRADGTIVKEDRDDPAQQADALDTFRYFCNNFLSWFKPLF
jgi:phage terminase large subunit